MNENDINLNNFIEKVKFHLNNHHLEKGLKIIKNNNIDMQIINDDINCCIEWLYNHKSHGAILSAYYKYGKMSNHTINELLHSMVNNGDYSSFLKQAYRFDVYEGFENEIEKSILWHENKKTNDALAWKLKFNKIKEIHMLSKDNISFKSELDIQEETDDFFTCIPKTFKLKPLYSNNHKKKIFLNVKEDDPYIISQTARVKIENANNIHKFIIEQLKILLKNNKKEVYESKLIDTFSILDDGPAIFEINSINDNNEREQIRHAISQLYEYRYLHSLFNASLWIVFSKKPYSEWYINYLVHDRKIRVLWFDNNKFHGPSIKLISKEGVKVE